MSERACFVVAALGLGFLAGLVVVGTVISWVV